jgi:hypothetical protein
MDFFYPGYNRDVGNGMEGNNYSCGMGKNGVNFYFLSLLWKYFTAMSIVICF